MQKLKVDMNMKDKVREAFRDKYGKNPEIISFAPGRVNIIGEHTDYNEGFVMPAALEQGTYFAGAKNRDKKIRIFSLNLKKEDSWEIEHSRERKGNFSDYLRGILNFLPFLPSSGIDGIVLSNIPIGAGLSSSAAFEISFIFLVSGLFNLKIEPTEIVKIAHHAENEFAGLKCGIMDQFVSVFGKKDHLIFLDTRTMEYEYVPFPFFWEIAVVNSGIKRELTSSQYNRRKEECEEAVKAIKKLFPEVKSLRDVTEDMLFEARKLMNERTYKRAMHVISENRRALEMKEYLFKNDACMIEKTMKLAHQSLAEDFEVSLPELDFLVDVASSLPYVHGARLTGAGFGGSIVALIQKNHRLDFENTIKNAYRKKFSIEAEVFFSSPSGGAYFERA